MTPAIADLPVAAFNKDAYPDFGSETPLFPIDPALWPDDSKRITTDEKPVDSIYAEKLQRLLIESLYSSWTSLDGKPFLAMTNVGLFFKEDVVCCPDMMLSLGATPKQERHVGKDRSFFCWITDKVPEVVIEIVADTRGKEDSAKKRLFAKWRIPYYVIYDHRNVLKKGLLRAFVYKLDQYVDIDPSNLAAVGLGLRFWTGEFEGDSGIWLRWYDVNGQLVLTGRERAEKHKTEAATEKLRTKKQKEIAKQERERAEERDRLLTLERERAERQDRLIQIERENAERLKLLAVKQENQAEKERLRAEAAEEKMRNMMERLKQLGEKVD